MGSVTCPEDCSKLPGRSKPLPRPHPGCDSLHRPIKTIPLCGARPAPDPPEGASALTGANSIPAKHDILTNPFPGLGVGIEFGHSERLSIPVHVSQMKHQLERHELLRCIFAAD